MATASSSPGQWPTRWERAGLIALALAALLFGGLVELRSAFLSRRMGDLGCYLRPAWAVRVGLNIYQIQDDTGWHYCYPPTLAVLLTPLADAPPGVARTGLLPFWASVGLWYVFNLACLCWAVHTLARALEETTSNGSTAPRSGVWSPPPLGGRARVGGGSLSRFITPTLALPHPGGGNQSPPWSRRWWALRLLPVLACLPPVGHTLMRGQVNLLILAFLCGALAALVRGRSFRAGLFLSGAICIKVIPAFLLIWPLWRRDGRCLAGAALGLAVGLGAIPLLALGPTRTVEYYAEFGRATLTPGLGLGGDQTRAKELTQITATGSQSLLAAMHNTLDLDRVTRPKDASLTLRGASLLVTGMLTLVILWAVGWKKRLSSTGTVLAFGALILVMMLASPVCHLHYFCLCIPLLMGLLARSWQQQTTVNLVTPSALALLFISLVVFTLPNWPGLHMIRDLCIPAYLALLLCGLAVVGLRCHSREALT